MEKTQEDRFPSWRSSMSSYCTLYLGPIEAQETHEYCILCLGLAYVEAALTVSDCPHFEEFLVRVLRSRRNIALGDFSRQRPTAASEPLVGPPHGSGHTQCASPPSFRCTLLKTVFDPPLVPQRLFHLALWETTTSVSLCH